MEVDFEKFSKQTAQKINTEIDQLLKEWSSEVGKIDKNLLPLIDEFIKANKGGKGLRGVLVVLGYQLARDVILSATKDLKIKKQESGDSSLIIQNDKNGASNDIFKVAAAYEIIHTALLMHDDVMDQSKLRRGKPSLYMALGGNHYGISQAINLGDAGFFLAIRAISEADFPDPVKVRALKWFCQIMLDTAAGQILDLEKADPLKVAKLKTARYTLVGPLVLGAILAGVTQLTPGVVPGRDLLNNLAGFGNSLGIAFQIKDDILDSEVRGWGGVELAAKTAEKYKNQALKILPSITKSDKLSKLLEQLAEYLVERKK